MKPPNAIQNSYSSFPTLDRDNRLKFPRDLNPKDHYFKPDHEFPGDMLAISRNGVVDYFRIMKWAFHEIKGLNLRNRAFNDKLEDLEAKVSSLIIAECGRKEDIMRMKVKDNEGKFKFLEDEIGKMKNTMKTIMEHNHRMEKHNSIIISAMFEKLEISH